ncbi:MAG: hypothetical protein HOJ56_05875, partial [Acidimicrobiaceae bacterium]|nr:hypothetical protein [Acidimicrobiaceae bacterium]
MSQPRPILVWCGRFRSHDGYGTAARALIRAAEAADIPWVAIDTEGMELAATSDDALVAITELDDRLVIEPSDRQRPLVAVVHERPDRYCRVTVAGRARSVGITYWEAANLPSGWSDLMLAMDEIWAGSAHNRTVFAAAGIPDRMLEVVPLPVDADAVLTNRDRDPAWGQSTVYLSILSGVQRRDIRLLFESFDRAFTSEDDVALVIKTRPGSRAEVEQALHGVRDMRPQHPPDRLP